MCRLIGTVAIVGGLTFFSALKRGLVAKDFAMLKVPTYQSFPYHC